MTNGDKVFENVSGVFALAAFKMWAAIPLGFHVKLHPGLLILATVPPLHACPVQLHRRVPQREHIQ